MSPQGVPASFPGTRAGSEAGDLPGERPFVTMPKQTVKASAKGATTPVGTIYADIVTVPVKGIKLTAPKVHGVKGATAEVNIRIDGDDLLSSTQKISAPGATLVVDADQYQQHALKQKHIVNLIVKKFTAAKGGTIEVTPKVYTLHS